MDEREDLERLGRIVSAHEDARVRGRACQSARQFIAEYAARARRRPARFHRGMWRQVGICIAVALVSAAVAMLLCRRGPFTAGSGHDAAAANWQRTHPDVSVTMLLADGTWLELTQPTRARIAGAGTQAEIVIEPGHADLELDAVGCGAGGAKPWWVNFGPFTVQGSEARLDLEWDPRADELTLNLFEGDVLVTGCTGQSLRLVAGQTLRASCHAPAWAVAALARSHTTGRAR